LIRVMSVILILILTSLAVAGGFLAAFIWAVRSGQYEDTQTPSMRILAEEETVSASATPGAPRFANLQRLGARTALSASDSYREARTVKAVRAPSD